MRTAHVKNNSVNFVLDQLRNQKLRESAVSNYWRHLTLCFSWVWKTKIARGSEPVLTGGTGLAETRTDWNRFFSEVYLIGLGSTRFRNRVDPVFVKGRAQFFPGSAIRRCPRWWRYRSVGRVLVLSLQANWSIRPSISAIGWRARAPEPLLWKSYLIRKSKFAMETLRPPYRSFPKMLRLLSRARVKQHLKSINTFL